MDTICDEASIDPDAKRRAKELEVIEIEYSWENAIYSENDRIVRKYFQVSGGLVICSYY